jgi:hypothetical protein
MYVLRAPEAPSREWIFCGPDCLVEWARSDDYSRQRDADLTASAVKEWEAMAQHLVATGAVDKHDPDTIETLLTDLFEGPGVSHMPLHLCTQCGHPRLMIHSTIILSPGVAKGRGPRRRRVLCSIPCLVASISGDIERMTTSVELRTEPEQP